MEHRLFNTKTSIAGTALFLAGIGLLIAPSLKGYDLQNAIFFGFLIGVVILLCAWAILSGTAANAILMMCFKLLCQRIGQYWESMAFSWLVILIALAVGILNRGMFAGNRYGRPSKLLVAIFAGVTFIGLSAICSEVFNFFNLPTIISAAIFILAGISFTVAGSNPRGQDRRTNINLTQQSMTIKGEYK